MYPISEGGMFDEDDEAQRRLEELEATGSIISPETMTSKQRYKREWGRGEAAKKDFDAGILRRDGQIPWAEAYNKVVARYGRKAGDLLVEHGFSPFAFLAMASLIMGDLDL